MTELEKLAEESGSGDWETVVPVAKRVVSEPPAKKMLDVVRCGVSLPAHIVVSVA